MSSNANREKALESALAQIDKSYGKGSIMRLGDEVRTPIEVIPTGSVALDIALGIGGLPRGRVVEVYGPESSRPKPEYRRRRLQPATATPGTRSPAKPCALSRLPTGGPVGPIKSLGCGLRSHRWPVSATCCECGAEAMKLTTC